MFPPIVRNVKKGEDDDVIQPEAKPMAGLLFECAPTGQVNTEKMKDIEKMC